MRNHQDGFTLIEVLISITILSFLMVYVYSIVDSSSRTKDIVTTEDRELMDIERALDRIDIDFSQIDSPLYYSPRFRKKPGNNQFGNVTRPNLPEVSDKFPLVSYFGKPVPNIEAEDKSTFVFMSNANRRRLQDVKQGRSVWIRYSLGSDENSRGGYQLIRQFAPENIYGPENNWDKIDPQLLLNHVKSFAFEYWDPSKKKWATGLRELNNHKDTLKMIRIKMEWLDSAEVIHEFVRTYRILWTEYDPYQDELIYKKAEEVQEDGKEPANKGDEF